jgi:UDP-N-acetyl-2-amino-2-deoxyglucuronate dehydrogenase
MDGGAFMNQASHYVDMVDWLVGPVDNVHAYTATLARDIEAEDTGVMPCAWRRGAWPGQRDHADPPEEPGRLITVLGERGTVRIGGVAVNKIEHWEFDETPAEDAAKVADGQLRHPDVGLRLRPPAVLRQRHQHAARRGACRDRRLRGPALAGGADCRCYRSARDGTRVGLPLEY